MQHLGALQEGVERLKEKLATDRQEVADRRLLQEGESTANTELHSLKAHSESYGKLLGELANMEDHDRSREVAEKAKSLLRGLDGDIAACESVLDFIDAPGRKGAAGMTEKLAVVRGASSRFDSQIQNLLKHLAAAV